jgi:hypothetical protein
MPVIRFVRTAPTAVGIPRPATGKFRFRPSKARTIPGSPDNVVTPVPFAEPLTAGTLDVTLEPTGPGWAWRVDESVDGIRDVTYFVVVPDVAGPLDDADLVRVDPATLAPDAAPTAAWWADLEALRAQAAGGFTVDPVDTDVLLITTRADGSIAEDPGDPDVLIIATS